MIRFYKATGYRIRGIVFFDRASLSVGRTEDYGEPDYDTRVRGVRLGPWSLMFASWTPDNGVVE